MPKTCDACGRNLESDQNFCGGCGVPVVADKISSDPYVGQLVAGKFLIQELIGVGAMGMVYRAEQVVLRKTIAVKILRQALLGDKTVAKRFGQEARAASRLNHPNSIQVLDFGELQDGALFMAMEFIQGRDLGKVIQSDLPLSTARIVKIMQQICSTLDEAHGSGIIHRDLKPANILLSDLRSQKDFVKVLDFGIAKIVDPDPGSSVPMTREGFVCGTPAYMSPEQVQGVRVDHRTDIFSLGILLYQLLTGMLPFDGESAVEIATKIVVDEPILPSKARCDWYINPVLEQVAVKAMVKDRKKRYQSTLEMGQDLDKALMAVSDLAVDPSAMTATNGSAAMDDDDDDGGQNRSRREVVSSPTIPEGSIVHTAQAAVSMHYAGKGQADTSGDGDEVTSIAAPMMDDEDFADLPTGQAQAMDDDEEKPADFEIDTKPKQRAIDDDDWDIKPLDTDIRPSIFSRLPTAYRILGAGLLSALIVGGGLFFFFGSEGKEGQADSAVSGAKANETDDIAQQEKAVTQIAVNGADGADQQQEAENPDEGASEAEQGVVEEVKPGSPIEPTQVEKSAQRAEDKVVAAVSPAPVETKKVIATPQPKRKTQPQPRRTRQKSSPKAASAPKNPTASPREQARELYREGTEHFRQRRYDKAIVSLEGARRFDPNMAIVYRELGKIHMRMRERDQAVTYYKKYVDMAPNASDAGTYRTIIATTKD